ncbi:TatD family hydrolase [Azotosporobacter soli]|uniref:TatD family hydrolase n=1 Tax=Azotosporobacter soli TaxID=3055040 RepID=UPI0031FF4029
MLFDSHAHLTDERFDDDRDDVIERAKSEKISGIINAGACMKSSAASIALANRHPFIYAAVGIHPHDAKDAVEADYAQMEDWLRQEKKVIAVGEIGLDYYYDFSPKEVQKEVFLRQLQLAKKNDRPVIIHNRDSHGDMMEILRREAKGMQGVLHCFSGGLEMARELLKMGFYLSVAGPLTYKNAAVLPEVVKEIPLERLLIETDCPYLTPQPHRGKRNEPAYVRYVAEKIAEIKGKTWQEVASVTRENTLRLFRIAAK